MEGRDNWFESSLTLNSEETKGAFTSANLSVLTTKWTEYVSLSPLGTAGGSRGPKSPQDRDPLDGQGH